MLRTVGGVIAGVVVVGVVVLTLQQIGASLHPLPETIDPMDPADNEAFLAHLAGMPIASWIVAFGSEVLGAFLGALTAAWIARRHIVPAAGLIVSLALVGSIMNWTSFPHPVWFIVGQLVLYPMAFILVLRIVPDPASQGANAHE